MTVSEPAPIYFWGLRGESKSTECVQDIAIYPGLSSECGIWHPDILAIIPTNESNYDSKRMVSDALGGSNGHWLVARLSLIDMSVKTLHPPKPSLLLILFPDVTFGV